MDTSKITEKWFTTVPVEGVIQSTSPSKQPAVTYDQVAVELTGEKKLNRGFVSLETKIGVMDGSIMTMASDTSDGRMSSADYTKLHSITGYNYENANDTSDGLMSSSDYSKLSSVDTSANYIKVDTGKIVINGYMIGLAIDGNNKIYLVTTKEFEFLNNITNGSFTNSIKELKYVGDVLNKGELGTITPETGYNYPSTVTVKDSSDNVWDTSINGGIVTLLSDTSLNADNVTITAVCPIKTFDVELFLNHGTIESGYDKIQTIDYNKKATWKVTADRGYHYSSVNNGTYSNGTVTSNAITDDTSVGVVFDINTQNVTLSQTYTNSIVTSDAISQTIEYGKTATWTVTPNWTGGYKNPITITNGSITASGDSSVITSDTVDLTDITVTATATKRNNANITGTITHGSFSKSITKYEDDVITASTQIGSITPATGYNYPTTVTATDASNNAVDVSINAGAVSVTSATTLTTQTTVTAVCPIKTFAATLNVVNGKIAGTELDSSTLIVDYNTDATWTIEANSGYTITGATTTGCTISDDKVTISKVTAVKSATVTCIKLPDLFGYYGFSTIDPTLDITAIKASVFTNNITSKPITISTIPGAGASEYLMLALPNGATINQSGTSAEGAAGPIDGFAEAWYKPSDVDENTNDTITISGITYSVYITDVGLTSASKSATIDWTL